MKRETNMILIGILGKARCGKTTAAEYLEENYGYKIVSTAGPLKKLLVEALKANPPPQDVFSHTSGATNPPSHARIYDDRTAFTRWLLQFVGTDICRVIDTNVWINQLLAEVTAYKSLDNSVKIVVPDIRFPNEVMAVRMLGGKLLKILRVAQKEANVTPIMAQNTEWGGQASAQIEFGAEHESEKMDDLNFDIKIAPAEGVENVHAAVKEVLGYLEAK